MEPLEKFIISTELNVKNIEKTERNNKVIIKKIMCEHKTQINKNTYLLAQPSESLVRLSEM